MAEDCARFDVGCHASNVLGGVFDEQTEDIKEFVKIVVEATFTGWLNIPIVGISGDFGPVGFLRDHLAVLVGGLLVLAIIGFAIAMLLLPKRETFENGGKFAVRTISVYAGSITIATLVVAIAEGYSTWIIDQATDGDGLATALLNAVQITGPMGFFGAMFFGGFAALFSVIQGGLLIFRNLVVPMLIGAAPVVVSVSQTEIGRTWWTKYLGWFIAYVLYKPVAATIYAVGFYMLSQGNILGSETVGEAALAGMSFMYGLAMMALSIFAFSAMMTVVTPIVGKMTGGMAGAGALAVSAGALAAGGAINKGVSVMNNTTQQGPATVTPSNAAAGATGGSTGSTGASGAAGAAGAAGASGWGTVHPVAQGAQLAGQAASTAQQGVSNSINNDKDDR